MIEIRKLAKAFGGREVVTDLDLTVPPGRLFAFLGPNGAGKTTTMKILVGLLRPTRGEVKVFGEPMRPSAVHLTRRIGYVPDQPYLYDKLTGMEFLHFVARMYGMERGAYESGIARLCEQFELGPFLHELCESYSHGMKQRVVLASAFLHGPDILIVDEPMVGLDPKSAHLLKRLLREMTAAGGIVLMSTHTRGSPSQRIGNLARGRRGRGQGPCANRSDTRAHGPDPSSSSALRTLSVVTHACQGDRQENTYPCSGGAIAEIPLPG